MDLRKLRFSRPTVYFGGGTPSLMDCSFFEAVLSRFNDFSEVTVELNPFDVSRDYLRCLKGIGVNRISLGVQSFSDQTLRFLGRRQTVRQNLEALENAVSVFDNVSVDLIYGIYGQSLEDLRYDLKMALSFPIKHISTYALTIYDETPFGKLHKIGKLKIPSDETYREMYKLIVDFLGQNDLRRYEISNFAIPKFESKHNLNYWKLGNYAGFGPSAASFIGNRFMRNISNLSKYTESLSYGQLPKSDEDTFLPLDMKQLKLSLGLRMAEGVDISKLGVKGILEERLSKIDGLKQLLDEGFVDYSNNKLKLADRSFFISNSVISRLLYYLFEPLN